VPLDDVVHRTRPAAGDPHGAIVLLHGRGTDENDLFPLIDILDPDRRLAGFTLRGPLNLPPGGWHWYRLGGIPTPDPPTFEASYELVTGWLDSLPDELGVPPARTVIGGFSQGSVMSYAVSLGEGRPSPAGVIALSGFIPRVPEFSLDLDSRTGLPVAIGHGTYDPVIPVEFGREAKEMLEQAGLDVSWRETPMQHSVDPAFLGELAGWIRERVPA
jgi:phospholipase/carboxylesterase